jgi:hypothetical protein
MSKLLMFAVYDHKAEAYGRPFFEKTLGLATRGFQEACNSPETQLNKYPEDYTLFQLGQYDEIKGSIDVEVTPKPLYKAIEFIKQPMENNIHESQKQEHAIGDVSQLQPSTES